MSKDTLAVAFIDDETSILDGLKRMLRRYRNEWNMHFFTNAEDALETLKSTHFDIVVSDMKMPGMNGADFLKSVQDVSPATLRIALSGYADSEITLESLHASHQFIAKPASAETLCACLTQALDTQTWLSDDSLKSDLGSIKNIPTLPDIYNELMTEIASEQSSVDNLARIIRDDLSLSVEILRIVNSAYFGLISHVESIAHAVSLLGRDSVKNIALLSSVYDSLPKKSGNLSRIENINKKMQSYGALAAEITKTLDISPRAKDHAQLASMLADLGELIHACFPETITYEENAPLVGAYLLSSWSLPFPVIEAVRWHQAPSKGGLTGLSPLFVTHVVWACHECFDAAGEINIDHPAFDAAYLNRIDGHGMAVWIKIAQQYFTRVD